MKKILLSVGLASGMFGTANAHNVWLERDEQSYTLVYGHVGESESSEPDKVKAMRTFFLSGKFLSETPERVDGHVVLTPASDVTMITVEYDNGYWTRTEGIEWENRSKRDFEKFLESSHSVKFNKNVLAWTDRAREPAGMMFEVVPMENPWTLNADQRLNLQVLLRGQPLQDAAVEVHGDDSAYKTDRNGYVTVAINGEHAMQHITAYHRTLLNDDPDADELSLSANLVFYTR